MKCSTLIYALLSIAFAIHLSDARLSWEEQSPVASYEPQQVGPVSAFGINLAKAQTPTSSFRLEQAPTSFFGAAQYDESQSPTSSLSQMQSPTASFGEAQDLAQSPTASIKLQERNLHESLLFKSQSPTESFGESQSPTSSFPKMREATQSPTSMFGEAQSPASSFKEFSQEAQSPTSSMEAQAPTTSFRRLEETQTPTSSFGELQSPTSSMNMAQSPTAAMKAQSPSAYDIFQAQLALSPLLVPTPSLTPLPEGLERLAQSPMMSKLQSPLSSMDPAQVPVSSMNMESRMYQANQVSPTSSYGMERRGAQDISFEMDEQVSPSSLPTSRKEMSKMREAQSPMAAYMNNIRDAQAPVSNTKNSITGAQAPTSMDSKFDTMQGPTTSFPDQSPVSSASLASYHNRRLLQAVDVCATPPTCASDGPYVECQTGGRLSCVCSWVARCQPNVSNCYYHTNEKIYTSCGF